MTTKRPLIAVVLTHLAISLVHGSAHAGAHVPLTLAGTWFVFIVILAGPLVGLAVSWLQPRTGAAIVAVAMAGALVFGLVNHFLVAGTDNVAHVAAEWRSLFGLTAALLVVSEGAGVAIAIARYRSVWSEARVGA